MALRTAVEGETGSAVVAGFLVAACLGAGTGALRWSYRQRDAGTDVAPHGSVQYSQLRLDGGQPWLLPRTDLWPLRRSAALMPLLSPFRRTCFVFTDVVVIGLLAVITAFRPSDSIGCTLQLSFAGLVAACATVALGVVRPYRTLVLNGSAAMALAGVALVALGSAVESSLPGGFGTAAFVAGSIVTEAAGAVMAGATTVCLAFDAWRTWRRATSPELDDDAVFEERRVATRNDARQQLQAKPVLVRPKRIHEPPVGESGDALPPDLSAVLLLDSPFSWTVEQQANPLRDGYAPRSAVPAAQRLQLWSSDDDEDL
jgi:hypothetical protein